MKSFILPIFIVTAMSATALAETPKLPVVAARAANTAAPVDAPASTNTAAPVAGANSFTEAQAKEYIEKAGFSSVGTLTRDANGVRVGKASKNGVTANVMLDFKGNVTSN